MTTTEKVREEYQQMVESLKQQRDEMKLKAHLANMEAHDEWQELEKQWHTVQAKGKQIGKETERSAHEAIDSLMELGHELKEGYSRISRLF